MQCMHILKISEDCRKLQPFSPVAHFFLSRHFLFGTLCAWICMTGKGSDLQLLFDICFSVSKMVTGLCIACQSVGQAGAFLFPGRCLPVILISSIFVMFLFLYLSFFERNWLLVYVFSWNQLSIIFF